MYELEKVLELKKDSFTHTSFLEEVLQVILFVRERDIYPCGTLRLKERKKDIGCNEYCKPVLAHISR